MNLSKKDIRSLTERIQVIADTFYQRNQVEAFQKFATSISELSELANLLFQRRQEDRSFQFDEQQFLRILTEAMNALEVRDDVLLADILNYDLNEILKDIEKQL